MSRVEINNLGMLPLAGVCDYERACGTGYGIDRNVELLRRYVYIESQLNRIFAAHIASVPEWETKCAFSLHLWLDAEHSAMLRKRITEMREPPHHLDRVPDVRLEAFFQELIRSGTTLELLTGIYAVAKPELIRALRKHMAETNPLVDHPTCRLLKFVLLEEEEMQTWGDRAIGALVQSDEDRESAGLWREHLESFLFSAGGFSGDMEKPVGLQAFQPRTAPGIPYEMKLEPQRDSRFKDNYNNAAKIDSYYLDETLDADERTYALLYKRLREMDVPEWMGPIIYKTEGKPWEYYLDLSRQLWDEARHAMMGEIGLYQDGVPFYRYPVECESSIALNTRFEPVEAHIALWYIEQGLMPKDTGKRLEWIIAKASSNELAKTFQDYDWADEVLHAQIGRKWLVTEFGSLEELKRRGDQILRRMIEEKGKLDVNSDQKQWWPSFVADMREGRERIGGRQFQPQS